MQGEQHFLAKRTWAIISDNTNDAVLPEHKNNNMVDYQNNTCS